jgi:hypothetical protein
MVRIPLNAYAYSLVYLNLYDQPYEVMTISGSNDMISTKEPTKLGMRTSILVIFSLRIFKRVRSMSGNTNSKKDVPMTKYDLDISRVLAVLWRYTSINHKATVIPYERKDIYAYECVFRL